MVIVQSIESSKNDYSCSFWHIKFFGINFSPELRKSEHGFILRAKPLQDVAALTEELRCVYNINPECFLVKKGVT